MFCTGDYPGQLCVLGMPPSPSPSGRNQSPPEFANSDQTVKEPQTIIRILSRQDRMSNLLNQPAETSPDDAWVIEFVRDRDRACPLCGYNVRNLTTARCPECGHRLRLQVQPLHTHLGAWVMGISALIGSAAIGIFFIWFVILRGMARLLSGLHGSG